MDLAPALPPAQDNALVVVATVADFPTLTTTGGPSAQIASAPVLINQSAQLPSAAPPAAAAAPVLLPEALASGIATFENLSKPSGFLLSSQLARSFSFVGQAFRLARLGNLINRRPQYSASLPIQWAHSNHWKSWAAAADIQVTPVDAKTQIATIENNAWAASIPTQCMPQADRELQSGPHYRLSIREKTLGYVADEQRAYLLAQQLKRLVRQASFEADAITPWKSTAHPTTLERGIFASHHLTHGDWLIGTADQPLFSVDSTMAEEVGYSSEWAAVAWANNLRLALDTDALSTGEAQMSLKSMQHSNLSINGTASWYGPYFHGRKTANGETFNQHDLTVAHKSLPFGTHLKIRNLLNDKTVVVRVNDRGPYMGDRSLDLSKAAAECLGSQDIGVIPYEAVVLKKAKARR